MTMNNVLLVLYWTNTNKSRYHNASVILNEQYMIIHRDGEPLKFVPYPSILYWTVTETVPE